MVTAVGSPDDDGWRREVHRRLERLESRRVTVRGATVTAIDTATATFTADVEGAGIVSGIVSAADFMPSVDDVVTIELHGPVPFHRVGRVTAEDLVALDDLSVDSDPKFMGLPFSEHLSPKAEFQAGASLGSVTDPALTTAGETGFYEATMEFFPGELYEWKSSNIWIRPNAGTTRMDLNCRYTVSADPNTAPPAVSTASNLYARWVQACDGTANTIGFGAVLQRLVKYPNYAHFRFLLSLVSSGGTGYIEMNSASHSNATTGTVIEPECVQLWATTQGVHPWTNRAVLNSGAGTPAAVTRKVYTYYPNWSRRFTGSGAIHSNQSHAAQGQAPDNAANGNQASQFGDFKRNGTGNSIATDTSGATIEKVECYLFARETGLANGLTASIKYHTNTSAPGSLSGGAGTAVNVSGWKASQGLWVDITQWASVFQAGTAKGIQIGPGISTSAAYFGVFADDNDARPPALRVTFTK